MRHAHDSATGHTPWPGTPKRQLALARLNAEHGSAARECRGCHYWHADNEKHPVKLGGMGDACKKNYTAN